MTAESTLTRKVGDVKRRVSRYSKTEVGVTSTSLLVEIYLQTTRKVWKADVSMMGTELRIDIGAVVASVT